MTTRDTLLIYAPVLSFPYFILAHIYYLHSKNNSEYEKLLLVYATLCMFLTGYLAIQVALENRWVTL
jgi:hypothetical protein